MLDGDALLIDTPSVVAAYDEAIAELDESATVMRNFATEATAFGDITQGNAQVLQMRVDAATRRQILSEVEGLELSAQILREMRLAISSED